MVTPCLVRRVQNKKHTRTPSKPAPPPSHFASSSSMAVATAIEEFTHVVIKVVEVRVLVFGLCRLGVRRRRNTPTTAEERKKREGREGGWKEARREEEDGQEVHIQTQGKRTEGEMQRMGMS